MCCHGYECHFFQLSYFKLVMRYVSGSYAYLKNHILVFVIGYEWFQHESSVSDQGDGLRFEQNLARQWYRYDIIKKLTYSTLSKQWAVPWTPRHHTTYGVNSMLHLCRNSVIKQKNKTYCNILKRCLRKEIRMRDPCVFLTDSMEFEARIEQKYKSSLGIYLMGIRLYDNSTSRNMLPFRSA